LECGRRKKKKVRSWEGEKVGLEVGSRNAEMGNLGSREVEGTVKANYNANIDYSIFIRAFWRIDLPEYR
jgi:hypothetical protein